MNQGNQLFVANLYPQCLDPANAIGLSAHTDHGLIPCSYKTGSTTFKYFTTESGQVEGILSALFVNTCDQIEIFTNVMYKSVVHKVGVNGSITRMSVVVSFGPLLDTFSGLSERLLRHKNSVAAYIGRTYGEYYDLIYKCVLTDGKTTLEASKIMPRKGVEHAISL